MRSIFVSVEEVFSHLRHSSNTTGGCTPVREQKYTQTSELYAQSKFFVFLNIFSEDDDLSRFGSGFLYNLE